MTDKQDKLPVRPFKINPETQTHEANSKQGKFINALKRTIKRDKTEDKKE